MTTAIDPVVYAIQVGCAVIRRGLQTLAAEFPGELAMYARWALAAIAHGPVDSIGYIGGGTAVMPRLLKHRARHHTVYEIEPVIVTTLRVMYPWLNVIEGDYRDTLRTHHDIIIYDLPGPVPIAQLHAHLNPNGLLAHST